MIPATFQTRDDAKSIIDRLDSKPYELRHGEHSRPDYIVRKIRNQSGYEIYVKYYYYPTSLHRPQNGALGSDFVGYLRYLDNERKFAE